MSENDVELAHRFNDAFNREGWQALWRLADPEIEFREPPEQPGASVFNGPDSARNGVTRSWDQLWSGQHSVLERVVDLGGGRVLILNVMRLRGRDGVEVTQRAGNIVAFRDDKILRFEAYWDQQAALDAAGLAG
jgi:ketosteroid isomerase-like protein